METTFFTSISHKYKNYYRKKRYCSFLYFHISGVKKIRLVPKPRTTTAATAASTSSPVAPGAPACRRMTPSPARSPAYQPSTNKYSSSDGGFCDNRDDAIVTLSGDENDDESEKQNISKFAERDLYRHKKFDKGINVRSLHSKKIFLGNRTCSKAQVTSSEPNVIEPSQNRPVNTATKDDSLRVKFFGNPDRIHEVIDVLDENDASEVKVIKRVAARTSTTKAPKSKVADDGKKAFASTETATENSRIFKRKAEQVEKTDKAVNQTAPDDASVKEPSKEDQRCITQEEHLRSLATKTSNVNQTSKITDSLNEVSNGKTFFQDIVTKNTLDTNTANNDISVNDSDYQHIVPSDEKDIGRKTINVIQKKQMSVNFVGETVQILDLIDSYKKGKSENSDKLKDKANADLENQESDERRRYTRKAYSEHLNRILQTIRVNLRPEDSTPLVSVQVEIDVFGIRI